MLSKVLHYLKLALLTALMLLTVNLTHAQETTEVEENSGGSQLLYTLDLGPIGTSDWYKGVYGLGIEKWNNTLFGIPYEMGSIRYEIALKDQSLPTTAYLSNESQPVEGVFHRITQEGIFNLCEGLHLRWGNEFLLGDPWEYSYLETNLGLLLNGSNDPSDFKEEGFDLYGNILGGFTGAGDFYGYAEGRGSFYLPISPDTSHLVFSLWASGILSPETPMQRRPVHGLLPRTTLYNPYRASESGLLTDLDLIGNVSWRMKILPLYTSVEYESNENFEIIGSHTRSYDFWLSASAFVGGFIPANRSWDALTERHGFGASLVFLSSYDGVPGSYGFSITLFTNEGVFEDFSNFSISCSLSSNPFRVNTWI